MSADSPASILFDINGAQSAVQDGYTLTVANNAIIAAGSDGTHAKFIKTDASGQLLVVPGSIFTVKNQDGYGNALTALTGAPTGTETGLVTRNIPNGTQTVSGTIAATQSGAWSTRTLDGYGNQISSSTSAPVGNETGLIVRNIPSGTQVVSTAQLPATLVGNRLDVNIGSAGGVVDAGNSSTTPLGGGATFTGTAADVLDYANISVLAFSNQNSAANGFNLQFSPDGTNWDDDLAFTLTANVGSDINTAPRGRFFRVVYTNGGVAQGVFRLQTIYKSTMLPPMTVRISDTVDANDDATLVKASIIGKTTAGGGSFVDVKVNPSGTLTVDASGSAVTVSGTIAATQSGVWNVNSNDGYGRDLTALTGTPTGTETGLVTRNIPSGTQNVSGTISANQNGVWTVNNNDGYGRALTALTNAPVGTETGLIVRNLPSGTQTVSGTVAATQSGTWSTRTLDGYGNQISSSTSDPVGTETGLIVRNIPSGNQLVNLVSSDGYISAGNSSTTPLAGNATFTGATTEILNYANMSVLVFADQDSAANGLKLEFSINGVNWDDILAFTVTANLAEHVNIGPRARYFRVVYVNGTSAQSVFRLQTILQPTAHVGTTVRISDVVDPNSSSILSKSSIVGKTTAGGGSFVDVKVNPSGALTVDASGNTIPVSQSGTWTVLSDDGYGRALTALTGTPLGTETGLVVRNIPSGIQSVSQSGNWTVRTQDGYGTPLTAMTTTPVGNETGLVVRIAGASAGGTSSNFTSAFPASGTAAGFNDGANMQAARVFDVDTGGGTQYVLGANLRLSSSGGSVEAGTATNPLRIDPTGTTAQPTLNQDGYGRALTALTGAPVGTETGLVVRNIPSGTQTISGTVSASQSGTWTALIDDGYGRALTALTAAPTGTETGLVVRNIPSGTQTISGTISANQSGNWTVLTDDGYGRALTALTGNPVGTETGLVTRNIPFGTQTISGTVSANQSGTWIVQTDDGYGRALTALTGSPAGTETGLVVRNIPSGTQSVSQSGTWIVNNDDGYGRALTALTGTPTGIETGLVVRNIPSGTQTISGTVSANQSGVWTVQTDDGYGRALTALTGTPLGTETGLVVRNIPSGTQTVSGTGTFTVSGTVSANQSGNWTVLTDDGYGRSLTALTGAPSGTETGLIVRNIPSGTQTISGTVSANQSGTWTINTDDGYGRALTALTGNPVGTETGLVTRNIPSGTQAVSGTISVTAPSTATRSSVASSATVVTLLASNTSRKGATFFNDSNQTLYMGFGSGTSVSDYTVQIIGGGFFEVTFPAYTGIITGIWASANGFVRVTELT